MAGEDLILAIPEELMSSAGFLITTMQALGWAIIFYIAFMVINTIINRKRNKKIDHMIGQVDNIVYTLEEIRKLLARPKRVKLK